MTDMTLPACPPYPDEHVSARGLYDQLVLLRRWVLLHRTNHNEMLGRPLIPVVKPLPDFTNYLAQSLQTQFGHLLVLRRLREGWDHLIRSNTCSWSEPKFLEQRVLVLQAAAVLLNDCGLPTERRELQQERGLVELQNVFTRVAQTLAKQLEVQHGAFP